MDQVLRRYELRRENLCRVAMQESSQTPRVVGKTCTPPEATRDTITLKSSEERPVTHDLTYILRDDLRQKTSF